MKSAAISFGGIFNARNKLIGKDFSLIIRWCRTKDLSIGAVIGLPQSEAT